MCRYELNYFDTYLDKKYKKLSKRSLSRKMALSKAARVWQHLYTKHSSISTLLERKAASNFKGQGKFFLML